MSFYFISMFKISLKIIITIKKEAKTNQTNAATHKKREKETNLFLK